MQAYQRIYPVLEELGSSLVALSPQSAARGKAGARECGLTFPTLSDPGNRTARDYRLVYSVAPAIRELMGKLGGVDLEAQNEDTSWELPIPGTFVIDRKGIVRLAFVQADYTRRLEPAQIVRRLRSLRREERPHTSASLPTASPSS